MHLAGALMEHFLEGSAPLRLCQVISEERRFVFVTLLIWINVHTNVLTKDVLTEQFLQENVPLRHLLNEETLFLDEDLLSYKSK